MDTPPDRLSVNPKSRFHDEDLLARGVGIRFKGQERNNVEEYCVSEGWIRCFDTPARPLALVHAGGRRTLLPLRQGLA